MTREAQRIEALIQAANELIDLVPMDYGNVEAVAKINRLRHIINSYKETK